jgi:signal transduction histidine kinase
MWWEFGQVLTYAPLTPLVFIFATRYPMTRHNWARRSLQYFAGGLFFTATHIALRAASPYAFWVPSHRAFESAIWDYRAHALRLQWPVLWNHFFTGVVDDITGVFIPIVFIAHAISYYRRFRERELCAAQLEGQLAKAHLQALKSQLQPHFLFNTMHSISSLMLTDVWAADQMMARLGDLLRMSLETAETQITSLGRELDFLNCYLAIEKVRFGNRLRVIMEIAPETLDASFPHLLLQPIVDNAVKHGIAKLPEGGELRITVRTVADQLQVEVEDNGPGIDRGGVFSASGFGLKLARERLKSLYGIKQSLDLLDPPIGALARIRIPFHPFSGDATASPADNALSRAG